MTWDTMSSCYEFLVKGHILPRKWIVGNGLRWVYNEVLFWNWVKRQDPFHEFVGSEMLVWRYRDRLKWSGMLVWRCRDRLKGVI